jgi:hypothetical protein
MARKPTPQEQLAAELKRKEELHSDAAAILAQTLGMDSPAARQNGKLADDAEELRERLG